MTADPTPLPHQLTSQEAARASIIMGKMPYMGSVSFKVRPHVRGPLTEANQLPTVNDLLDDLAAMQETLVYAAERNEQDRARLDQHRRLVSSASWALRVLSSGELPDPPFTPRGEIAEPST